ncbi:caM kinase-like vesicle-associated protein [Lates japonicus]|uniref:non-specific serine/threonine protein kinase n=1 Tax=Lates japonicus TaxID=270547 RepID=A0AAD3RFC3_LATJO|nr:caM kinase-like vesicle-associated protein [Lates japonicus]
MMRSGAQNAKWRLAGGQWCPVKGGVGGLVMLEGYPSRGLSTPTLRDRSTGPTSYLLLLLFLNCLCSTPATQRRALSGPIWSPSSCGQTTLRKVTVLLNRRGVVSFEQLLLDISEALGFPRWHRSRVTRLYTTHAREVKGVCDFFRGEAAFLALGKARPELSSVQEALEELFPEHSHYQADALRAWEKRLSPAPDKAAKADSGYINGNEEKKPLPVVGPAQKDAQQRTTFDLPPDSSDVTLSDIERCYEIGRVVGDGNFAVVRECRRRDSRQSLAMKIVERSKLIGREHMMQNELSLLGSLCHPRIVRLFAHHHTRTHSYLVMELVSGGDLFEAISERGKFSEAEAGLMVSDMSEALNYIHSKSIVHRDLKPENLLIERVAAGICRLKLGDFGLAMVVTEPVFTICGTPTYVAPEILCETGYGVAVDVWALGVILYILLCGFPPFRSRERDQEELFQLIKQGQLHFLSPYWDPISEEARGLVRALLQPDPTVRLTAEQTLLHPWVKGMASVCRQRALTDKTQRNTAADAGAEPQRVQRPAQTYAAETATDKRPEHTGSEGDITQKELSRTDERWSEMNTGREHDEDKTPQQQSNKTSTAHATSDDTPGQQKPECTSTDSWLPSREPSGREIQDSGPKLSNCEPGSTTSPRAELNQLGAPAAKTELSSQIKTQSKQNSQHQSPPASPPSANAAEQTTAGHSTQHHPSSSPAAPSSHSPSAEP